MRTDDNYLEHYGILRKSGRYPWGSGGNVEQRSKSFLDYIKQMLGMGLTPAEVAKGLSSEDHPFTTTDLRAATSIARAEVKAANIARATRLKDKGYSNVKIGELMGLNESSVRSLLAPGEKDKADILQATASMLKKHVDEKGMIDVGTGTEHSVGVSSTRLNTSLAILKSQGYEVHKFKAPQMGTGKMTEYKVLCPPGTTQKEAWMNRNNLRQIDEFSVDGGRSFTQIKPPLPISSKRVQVRYAEDGGADADGVIYVRPGPEDLSMGGKNYAQVRIDVDGTHYLKGMAMYKDDLPDGVDVVFNTNKSDTGNKLDAMKPKKDDPDNPFGSVVRQIGERDKDGNLVKVTSALNIVNEEGDWGEWSKNLSSQMLSKQSPKLAKEQLDLTYKSKKDELDEILSLTNPAVRKKLLESYADDADASAVHLKAAHLPRQRTSVILPVNSLKETEIYAPTFRNGERVALVRYPHGGIFEIPELTVNNRHPQAKKLLGEAEDAVGINSEVAKRLSGADFDGDTVLVIPNPINNPKIKTMPALEGLKDFDPQRAYPGYEGMPKMSSRTKGIQMGIVSNLITDMTIQGATPGELARAVRHSMVVIDAEKHNLNYRQSAVDNGIPQLKQKYQGGANAGASTIISRRKSEQRVPERKPRPAEDGGPIDKKTGEKVFVPTGRTRVSKKIDKKTGEVTEVVLPRTAKSTKLAEAKDAHTLSSGTVIEKVYADHSNRMKSLANAARLEMINTSSTPWNPSAKKTYANEVKSLEAKLNTAVRNRPRERQAQIIAGTIYAAKKKANPDMDKAEEKKLKGLALTEARNRTGAKKVPIEITDREWDAIQAGAISTNKLDEILRNSNLDRVKELATPRTQPLLMTSSKVQRAEAMAKAGLTQAEIADAFGVSLSTLKQSLGQ